MDAFSFGAAEIIAIVAVFIAVAAVFVPWWYQRNQLLLEQAVKSLERAYEALTDKGQKASPPAADRLNWLTAARHIVRYRMIKDKIFWAKTHRLLCEEHEEYWRHQFYVCLSLGRERHALHRDYYKSGEIEPQAAIIVHGFAEWPGGMCDPIDTVDMKKTLAETPSILQRNYGLRFFLESLPGRKET
ncbi:hypothetical protein [Pusillimonas sp.]|uniref:hypothetical protein n=1 Tax=Pusillimonas sp. TaxID=3040095 RepID=UPI0037CAB344